MIAIFSDTHSHTGHELTGDASEVAKRADAVIHAGDFTSTAALEAFQACCDVFYPVHGNADDHPVSQQLPTARTVEHDGLRIAVTHRRDGGDTALELFGRARDADIVVSGHTHRPRVVDTGELILLNPGSHVQPRGNRPGFCVLYDGESGSAYRGELREPDGTVFETFEVTRE